MKFIVGVREVHVSYREVEAQDAAEAVINVRNGNGEEVSMEYSHTPDDTSCWTVEKSE